MKIGEWKLLKIKKVSKRKEIEKKKWNCRMNKRKR